VAYPTGWYYFTIRVSTVSPRWALVRIWPAAGHKSQVQPDWASFLKRYGKWHLHGVHALATKGVPLAVVKDLKIPSGVP
jgi:hypothetical protein